MRDTVCAAYLTRWKRDLDQFPPARYSLNSTEIVKVIVDSSYDHDLHFNSVLIQETSTSSSTSTVDPDAKFFADAEYYAVCVVSSVSNILNRDTSWNCRKK